MPDPTTPGTWRHCTWFDAHKPQPDLTRTCVQPGTGDTITACTVCDVVVVFSPEEQRDA